MFDHELQEIVKKRLQLDIDNLQKSKPIVGAAGLATALKDLLSILAVLLSLALAIFNFVQSQQKGAANAKLTEANNQLVSGINRSDNAPSRQVQEIANSPAAAELNGRFIIYYATSNQLTTANAVAADLTKRLMVAQGIRLAEKNIPEQTEVRYYYFPDDRPLAIEVLKILHDTFKITDSRISYVIDPGRADRQIEIHFNGEVQ